MSKTFQKLVKGIELQIQELLNNPKQDMYKRYRNFSKHQIL